MIEGRSWAGLSNSAHGFIRSRTRVTSLTPIANCCCKVPGKCYMTVQDSYMLLNSFICFIVRKIKLELNLYPYLFWQRTSIQMSCWFDPPAHQNNRLQDQVINCTTVKSSFIPSTLPPASLNNVMEHAILKFWLKHETTNGKLVLCLDTWKIKLMFGSVFVPPESQLGQPNLIWP